MVFTLNRLAVVLVVLVLARVAWSNLMMGNFVSALPSALGAAAFACNWPLDVSRRIRIIAFIIQVFTVLTMAGLVALLLVLSDIEASDLREVPWWFWPVVAAVAIVVLTATARGYVLLRQAR